MITFTTQTMQEILPILQKQLEDNNSITLQVLDPDVLEAYAGTQVNIDKNTYIYRGLKSWVDLAEVLHCKVTLPKPSKHPMVTFKFVKLSEYSFHKSIKESEKYGTRSHFSQIYKMEEPAFYYYYHQALQNVNLSKRNKILNLGVNRADEFEVIRQSLPKELYQTFHLTGIDHSVSAIALAKERFPEENVKFYVTDINEIDSLGLAQFDLLISIGTLQSPSINFKPFFMSLVQNYLKKDSAVILGFPNSRWIGGELVYGAKAPNYSMSEQSLLYNDVMFCKKYLQQKKYRVTLTGKYYLILTATKIS